MFKRVWNTKITANDSTAQEELGAERIEVDATNRQRRFRYVQAAASVTIRKGTTLSYSDAQRTTVTPTISTRVNRPAGVAIGTLTASYYGWAQCGGYHDYVIGEAGSTYSDGDTITLHAGTNGIAGRVPKGVAAYYKPLGVAVTNTDSSLNVTCVMLDC